jgi:hypothetical protein
VSDTVERLAALSRDDPSTRPTSASFRRAVRKRSTVRVRQKALQLRMPGLRALVPVVAR